MFKKPAPGSMKSLQPTNQQHVEVAFLSNPDTSNQPHTTPTPNSNEMKKKNQQQKNTSSFSLTTGIISLLFWKTHF